ncbi:MAG: T9SS type A sorting domain-containing protein [Candidatus Cloacimonetes bacterium]|nr:T9SS type A sorting domain-containing protein [Candidatus Cloacimonadota bacterium]
MKKIIGVFLLLIANLLVALEFISVSGQDVSLQERETEIYYHQNTEDLNWFGSSRWCVRYDINEYFNSIDSLNFAVSNMKIFIPQVSEDITISLWKDGETSPADSLGAIIIPSSEQTVGWNNRAWDITLEHNIIWMVVDYPTFNKQVISASANDGSHSYFYEDGIYKNMLANGYASEFLFSLVGDFAFEFSKDLGISDFTLEGSAEADSIVYPKFTIKNNSTTALEETSVEYIRTAPEFAGFSKKDNFLVEFNPPLAIGEERKDIIIHELADTLLSDASMYDFTINLDFSEDEFPENNSSNYSFDTFNLAQPYHLIENFVRLDHYESKQVWKYQTNIIDPEQHKIVNYFPYAQDTFYHIDAVERFHYYHLGGCPAIIVDGVNKFIGYNAKDENSISQIIEQPNSKTYLELTSSSGTFDKQIGNVVLEINLKNHSTYLFPNYLENSQIFFALIEDIPSDGYDVYGSVFHVKIDQQKVNDLVYNNSQKFDVGFNAFSVFSPIVGANDYSNCKIYCWVENMETNRKDFLGEISFTDLLPVSSEEDFISTQKIVSYPNPSSTNSKVNIFITSTREFSEPKVFIYNIKGQRVAKLSELKKNRSGYEIYWDGKDEKNQQTASGIYFIKLLTNNRNSEVIYKKIVRINY